MALIRAGMLRKTACWSFLRTPQKQRLQGGSGSNKLAMGVRGTFTDVSIAYSCSGFYL